MNTLFLDALKGQNFGRPPIWLMRQAGRYMPSYRNLRRQYSFHEMSHRPELIVQVTTMPIDQLGVDAAILFSDILLLLEAIGADLHFDEEKGPLISNTVTNTAGLHAFSLNSIPEKLNFLPGAIGALKQTLKVPLIGFAGAPFTLASYLIEGKTSRDLRKTKQWAYRDPEGFQKLIDLLTQGAIDLLTLQAHAGVDALQLFDSWAGGLSEPHFIQYCQKPLKKISDAMRALEKPLLFFCRGSCGFAPLIEKTGVTGISLDWSQPICRIRKDLPGIPLQGNLDPETLYAPLPAVKSAASTLLDSMNGDPAYIFNLGHGILPDIPYEAVQHLVETVHNRT